MCYNYSGIKSNVYILHFNLNPVKMELKYRRIYAYTCIVLFIVLAPLLILYAAGYRYDFEKSDIIRTGVLTVDSDPRGATIILNNRVSKKKTNAVMKNLKPNDYHIAIEKEGYYSWGKILPVFPNKATLTNRVTLIKKSEPSIVLDNISQFNISPDNSTISYLIPSDSGKYLLKTAKLLDLGLISEMQLGSDDYVDFYFSSDSQYLFVNTIRQNINYYQIVFIKENGKTFDLSNITTLNFIRLKSETSSNKLVYGLAGEQLYQIDLNQGSIKLLLDDQINDFTITSDTIYYIRQSNTKALLKQAKLNEKTEPQELLTTAPGNYFLSNNFNGLITLLNQSKDILSLIKPSVGQALMLKQMNATVKGCQWSPDQKSILFFNDYELWYLNIEKEEQQLLIRSSETIESAQWHPDETWIVFLQNNKLKAIELDGRDARSIIELTDQNPIKFHLDANQNKIYFLNQEATKNGIYKLDLD